MGLKLRTTGASLIFIIALIAYTLQTELAQYVQRSYRKPYFLLYLTHSGYIILLPLHLLTLNSLNISIENSLSILRGILRIQFASDTLKEFESTSNDSRPIRRTSLKRLLSNDDNNNQQSRNQSRNRSRGRKIWKWNLSKTIMILTLLIALPALSWYAAVPLTSMTDITAIYNIFAFWAYLLAIRMLGEQPTKWKLSSVLVSILGVFIIAYGDSFLLDNLIPSKPSTEIGSRIGNIPIEHDATSRLMGNLLALIGSMTYAWYEVWYKLNVALPDPHSPSSSHNNNSEEEELANEAEIDTLLSQENHDVEDEESRGRPLPPSSLLSITSLDPSILYPSSSSYLLYSNFITSSIGLCTLLVLWIPIPFLHWLNWEVFELPPSESWLAIIGMMLSGVAFNACFMLLLSIWGPVIASVGNLCTLVLVAITDTILSDGEALSRYSLVGSGMVVIAFGMLVFGSRKEEEEIESIRTQVHADAF